MGAILFAIGCGPDYGYLPRPSNGVRMRWDGRMQSGCGQGSVADALASVPEVHDDVRSSQLEGIGAAALFLASAVVFLVGSLKYDGDHQLGADLLTGSGIGMGISGLFFADSIRRRDDAMNRYNDRVAPIQAVQCHEEHR
jgi:hypothetical protein